MWWALAVPALPSLSRSSLNFSFTLALRAAFVSWNHEAYHVMSVLALSSESVRTFFSSLPVLALWTPRPTCLQAATLVHHPPFPLVCQAGNTVMASCSFEPRKRNSVVSGKVIIAHYSPLGLLPFKTFSTSSSCCRIHVSSFSTFGFIFILNKRQRWPVYGIFLNSSVPNIVCPFSLPLSQSSEKQSSW